MVWKKKLHEDLEWLKKIQAHRGLCHFWGLCVQGQHTKTAGSWGCTVGMSKKKQICRFCLLLNSLYTKKNYNREKRIRRLRMLAREEGVENRVRFHCHRVIRECSSQTNAVHMWFKNYWRRLPDQVSQKKESWHMR